METTNEHIILTTRPSIKAIFVGSSGTLFFGWLAYLIYSSKWVVADGTDDKTGMIIMSAMLWIFIVFTVLCLFKLLSIKTVILTNTKLIIKWPFLFLKKKIPLDDLRRITESPLKIEPTIESITYKLYQGKNCLLEFYERRSIKINSFEMADYYLLIKKLNRFKRK